MDNPKKQSDNNGFVPEWQSVLVGWLLFASNDPPFPLATFEVRQATSTDEVCQLPTVLHMFYSLCDGGYFDHNRWLGVRDVLVATAEWRDQWQNAPDGELWVVAYDSGGAPIVVSEIGKVWSYWWKGGEWEQLAPTFDAFLTKLSGSSPDDSDLWREAKVQINALIMRSVVSERFVVLSNLMRGVVAGIVFGLIVILHGYFVRQIRDVVLLLMLFAVIFLVSTAVGCLTAFMAWLDYRKHKLD